MQHWSDRLKSLIALHAPTQMLSIAKHALDAKRYRLVKQEADYDNRFREHLRDVEKNDKDASKPVARHLYLVNHSSQHTTICGLSQHHRVTRRAVKV